jgi:rare lipoprotein A
MARPTRWPWMVALVALTGCATARPDPVPGPLPVQVGHVETGEASWYGHPYHGRRTSSGEVYDMHRMTAAHRTWPFGTSVEVRNLVNGRAVEVRVNDRGPFVDGRIIDLSYAAARLLDAVRPGVVPVRLRVTAVPGQTIGSGQTGEDDDTVARAVAGTPGLAGGH